MKKVKKKKLRTWKGWVTIDKESNELVCFDEDIGEKPFCNDWNKLIQVTIKADRKQ